MQTQTLSTATGKIVGQSNPWYRVVEIQRIHGGPEHERGIVMDLEVEYPDGGIGHRVDVPEQEINVFPDFSGSYAPFDDAGDVVPS